MKGFSGFLNSSHNVRPVSKTDCIIQEKNTTPGGFQEERHAERAQVRSAGTLLAQCPGVCSRGVPIPRSPPLDMSLIICCVTVVSFQLAEASGVCPRPSSIACPKLFFFLSVCDVFVCV